MHPEAGKEPTKHTEAGPFSACMQLRSAALALFLKIGIIFDVTPIIGTHAVHNCFREDSALLVGNVHMRRSVFLCIRWAA